MSKYLKQYGLAAQDIVELVKVSARLTVRIKGGFISIDRATRWFGQDGAYPFCEYRGSDRISHSGSGWVYRVREKTDESGNKYWEIRVFTARHVIYDQAEAAKCSITLFDVGDPSVAPVTLSGGEFLCGDTEDDWSQMDFTTQNDSLGRKLRGLWERRAEVVRTREEVRKSRCRRRRGDDDDDDVIDSPVLLLTYPHGKQCHATLGRLTSVEEKREVGWRDNSSVYYTTDSCPGSSGGQVVPVGRFGDVELGGTINRYMMTHPHSGAKSGLNLSAGRQLVAGWM